MEKDVLARIIEAERQIQECLNDQRAKAREWIENLRKEAEEDFAQEQIGMKESLGEAARTAQRLAETKAATVLVGIGGGYDYREQFQSFDLRAWDLIHLELFGRLIFTDLVHLDVGFFYANHRRGPSEFSCGQDPEACAHFLGGVVDFALGYKWIYWAPRLRLGVIDYGTGSEVGWIAAPLVVRILSTPHDGSQE